MSNRLVRNKNKPNAVILLTLVLCTESVTRKELEVCSITNKLLREDKEIRALTGSLTLQSTNSVSFNVASLRQLVNAPKPALSIEVVRPISITIFL